MFYLLHYTESMGKTKQIRPEKVWNQNNLKRFNRPIIYLRIKKLPYLSYNVSCNILPIDTTLNLYWQIYQNSRYRKFWAIPYNKTNVMYCLRSSLYTVLLLKHIWNVDMGSFFHSYLIIQFVLCFPTTLVFIVSELGYLCEWTRHVSLG